MLTLAQERNPKVWSDFFGYAFMVDRLKKSILTNSIPGAIFISANTGLGKGTVANLYIKSLLCINRKDDEVDPCNKCSNCLSDTKVDNFDNNLFWVQTGSSEGTVTAQTNNAVNEAYIPANSLSITKEGRKIIVFDEIQTIPKDKLSQLLFLTEVSQVSEQNKVTFIFITMDEDSINDSLCKALKSRCGSFYFKLPQPSINQLKEYTLSVMPSLSEESADIISQYSFSYRSVLQTIEFCLESCVVLEPSSISALLGFADKDIRKRLWEILESCTQDRLVNYRKFKEFWQILEAKVNEKILADQLEQDIDRSLFTNPNPNQLIALDYLLMYKSNNYISLQQALRGLMGKSIVDYTNFN